MPKKKLVIEDGMIVDLPLPMRIGGTAYSQVKVRGLRGGDLRRANLLMERKKPDFNAFVILLQAGVEEVIGYGKPSRDDIRAMPWASAELIYHYMVLLDVEDPEEPVSIIRQCIDCAKVGRVKVEIYDRKIEDGEGPGFANLENGVLQIKLSSPITTAAKDPQDTVTVGAVTVADMVELLQTAQDKSGETEYVHVLYMIQAIGNKKKGQFGMEVVDDMRPRDIRNIIREYYKNEPHLEDMPPAKCESCGGEVPILRIIYPKELLLNAPLAT